MPSKFRLHCCDPLRRLFSHVTAQWIAAVQTELRRHFLVAKNELGQKTEYLARGLLASQPIRVCSLCIFARKEPLLECADECEQCIGRLELAGNEML